MAQAVTPQTAVAVATRTEPVPIIERAPRSGILHAPDSSGKIWRAFVTVLHYLWQALRWIWTTLVVGGLATGAIVSYATTGTPGITDPSRWAIIELLTMNVQATVIGLGVALLVTVLAFVGNVAHRRLPPPELINKYDLRQVIHLRPQNYLPMYYDAYLPRRQDTGDQIADELAMQVLRQVAEKNGKPDGSAAIGICTFGRPLAGKTRLGWQTVQKVFPTWTFVRWAHGAIADFTPRQLRGRKVVLWLDNLQEYANSSEAPIVNALPALFSENDVTVVVVAACRSGEDELRARQYLRGLLSRLVEIRPSDISPREEVALITSLTQLGAQVQETEFDGTPGSLLLGIDVMRAKYLTLSEDAKRVMRALKLLRSAGIYEYPVARVRAVAMSEFNLGRPVGAWTDAITDLQSRGFALIDGTDANGYYVFFPVSSVYIDKAVPDYPVPGVEISDEWPRLQTTLVSCKDADAISALAVAYQSAGESEKAQECFSEALRLQPAGQSALSAAAARYSSALASLEQAESATGGARTRLLDEAISGLRDALRGLSRRDSPDVWAEAQFRLGDALTGRADAAVSALKIKEYLAEADDAYRAALQVYTPARDVERWAEAQQHRGLALQAHAEVESAEEARRLLSIAKSVYDAVLNELTPDRAPVAWAQVKRSRANALRDRGKHARTRRSEYWSGAESAYADALTVFTREAYPAEWAATQLDLARLAQQRATQLDRTSAREVLAQAQQHVMDALTVYTQDAYPVLRRQALALRREINAKAKELGG